MDKSGPSGTPTPNPEAAAITSRLDAIELRLERLEATLQSAVREAEVASRPPAATFPPPPTAQSIPQPPPSPVAIESGTASETNVAGSRWDDVGTEAALKWTGFALVVAAAAFLVNTAINRGWIQPIHQLLAAIGVGLALAWTAVAWRTTRPRWSQAAGIGSVLVLAISAGAANRWLGMIDVAPALVASIVVAVFGVLLALRIDRASVAATAATQALVLPLWLEAVYRYDLAWSTAWALAAVAATTVIGLRKDWPTPRTIVAGLTGVVLPLVLADIGADATMAPWVVQALLTALVAVAAAPLLLGRATASPPNNGSSRVGAWERLLQPQFDVLGAFAVPAIWWVATSALWASDVPHPFVDSWASEASYGVVAIGLAAATLIIVGLFVASTGRASLLGTAREGGTPAAMALGAVGLALVGLAFVLPGATFLVVASAVTAIGLGSIGAARNQQLVMAAASGLTVGTVLATFLGLVEGMAVGLSLVAAVAYLLVIALAGGGGVIYRGPQRTAAGAAVVSGWVGLMMWLWAVLGQVGQGQMLVSLVYALMGTAALLVGRRLVAQEAASIGAGALAARLPFSAVNITGIGLATLAVTVVKLVTVDLVAVDTLWRSLLFFVVGLGLLRIGLFIHRQGEATENAPTSTPTG